MTMFTHPPLSILAIEVEHHPELRSLFSYLRSISHIELSVNCEIPADLSPYDVIITADTAGFDEGYDHLNRFVNNGGGWLGLVQVSDKPLPEIFGAQIGQAGPAAELRVMFVNPNHDMAIRLPDVLYLRSIYQPLVPQADDAEPILYADWHFTHSPMLLARPVGEGKVACTTLRDYNEPAFQQVFYRLLRYLAGNNDGHHTLGVGLLGYAPSVGKIHGLGVRVTPGLELKAACDLNPERLQTAGHDFPDLKTYKSADAFAGDPDIDLVIIATPPNSHAQPAIQMMAAGKHVVCEKHWQYPKKKPAP
jgi:hypothetical protein